VDLPRPSYFTLTDVNSLSMLEGEISLRALITSSVSPPYCSASRGVQFLSCTHSISFRTE
jgi:hypothetical protein